MGYKRVIGRINHIRTALRDFRLEIDVAGSDLKRVFKGEVETELLRGATVKVYIPKVKNKKKEVKIDKGLLKKLVR